MKSIFPVSLSAAATALVLLTVAGCTTGHHRQMGMDGRPGAGPMGMDGRPGAGHMGMMDPQTQAMCAAEGRMMGARTPEERRAMMAEHVRNMPPEMMQRRMDMMRMEMQMMQERMSTQTPPK